MTEIKNMAYWRAKNTLPGIDPNSEGNTDTPDGKSGSSPLQEDYDLSTATVSNNKKFKGQIDSSKQSSKAYLMHLKQQDRTVDLMTRKASSLGSGARKYAIDYLKKKDAIPQGYKYGLKKND